MDKPSSTSNSNSTISLKPMLSTSLVVFAFLIIAELGTRLLFTPCIISVGIFERLNPAQLSYGFDEQKQIFHNCGEDTLFIGADPETIRRYGTSRSPNDMRLFILGGSVSLEPPNNNYSIQLEQALQRQGDPTYSYEVINTSAYGYGSSRMLVLLKQILRAEQKPNLIILHPHGSNEFEDEVQLSYFQDIQQVWYNRTLSQSQFFSVMKQLNQWVTPQAFAAQTSDAEKDAETDPVRVANWQKMLNENLTEICKLANQENIPVILLLRAINPTISDDNTFADERTKIINQNMRQHALQCNAIYILDTPSYLEAQYPNPSAETINELFIDTSHWHTKAHAAISAQILEIIKINTLLPIKS